MVMRYMNKDDTAGTQEIGRRDFVKAATAGVLAGWLPVFRVSPASAQATCTAPANFPSSISL